MPTTTTVAFCYRTGKVCYQSRQKARQAMRAIRSRPSRFTRREGHEYSCPYCHEWHLSSGGGK